MPRHVSILMLLSLLLTGCGSRQADNSLRPTIFTAPPSYLKSFPLGVPQTDVYNALGTPKTTMQMGGKEVWSYELGDGWGARTFTYEFAEGKVYDVRFNDQGPYNGITARGEQGKDAPKP